ncbi:MAG: SLC13 family permease [Candidatus Thorarchaeota archaeon]
MQIYQFMLSIILLVTLALLVIEKGDKIIVSLTGAGLALLLAIIPVWPNFFIENQNVLIQDVGDLLTLIEPDLMFIIIGMTLLVGVCAETGIFEWVALKILKLSNGNLNRLLLYLCFLTLMFSAFLDAYMAILIIGTITLVSSDGLYREDGEPINPRPFLLAEALFGNIGGMLTRVASPPNLILGTHFNIAFLDFTIAMFPIVLTSAVFSFYILKIVFKNDLNVKISESSIIKLLQLDENQVIRDKKLFYRAALIIFITIFGFFASSYFSDLGITIHLGYIALAGAFIAVALVSGEKAEHAIKNIEWSIIIFYCGLLTIVGIVERAQILQVVVAPIESIFEINLFLGLLSILYINTFFSSFLDNIPMAAIMKEIIEELRQKLSLSGNSYYPLVWAAVIGTNSGGNITPIASASGVQAVEMLNREKDPSRHVSFLDFMKIGFLIGMISITFGTIYLIFLASYVYFWI